MATMSALFLKLKQSIASMGRGKQLGGRQGSACTFNALGVANVSQATRRLGLFASALLLSACSNSLVVKGQFPRPLVQPLPLSAGAYYSPELTSHSYTEDSENRGNWTINTGNAQQQFFETLLPALFNQWQAVQHDPQHKETGEFPLIPDLDLVIRPQLTEFQYSLPRESRTKIFEVWMKYNMQVFQGDGELLADWFVTAYGKTPSAFMQSDEEAMNEAVVVALRDLGANLSINFSRVPELKSWLEEKQ